MKNFIRDVIGLAAASVFIAVSLVLIFSVEPPVKRVLAQSLSAVPTITSVTVGTGATMNAVPANPNIRALVICNGNATAANVLTVTFGAALTPVDGTVGLVIPGGQVAASCWTAPLNSSQLNNFWSMAQINLIAHVTSTPATILQF